MTSTRLNRQQVGDGALGWLSFATMFIVGTDTFLVAPLLPVLRRQFGIETEASGWLVSAYALGYALCALVAGPVSDRMDRRRMLLTGMVAFSLLTAACGLTWGFWPMIVLRCLTGVAAALASPQIWASIPQLVAPTKIVRTMGRATAGLSIAQMAGIPLGALLATISWQCSFFAVGVVAAVITVLLACNFPHVATLETSTGTSRGYGAVMSSGALMLGLFAYFIFQTGNFAGFSFFGSWFARDFGLSTTGIGIAMIAIGGGNAFGSVFGHRLVARMGNARSLVVGILAMTVGYVGVAFTSNLVVAVCFLTFVMASGGFVFPVMMATLQAGAPHARGTVSSLANVAMYGGTTLGAAVSGPLFAATPGFTGIAVFTILAFLIGLVLFVRAQHPRDQRRADHQRADQQRADR